MIFNRCQDFRDFPPLKVVGISKTICNCNNESNVSVLLSFIQSKFVDCPRNTILVPVVLNIPEKGLSRRTGFKIVFPTSASQSSWRSLSVYRSIIFCVKKTTSLSTFLFCHNLELHKLFQNCKSKFFCFNSKTKTHSIHEPNIKLYQPKFIYNNNSLMEQPSFATPLNQNGSTHSKTHS